MKLNMTILLDDFFTIIPKTALLCLAP